MDTDKMAVEAVTESIDEIRTYNLKQLLDGKTNKGADITPSYFNDPFFKTPAAAAAYSRWKDQISPPSNRKSGVPNYYINGYTHRSLKVVIEGDKIVSEFKTPYGKQIEAKSPDLFGLSPQSRAEFIPLVLRPRFMSKVQILLGLKPS